MGCAASTNSKAQVEPERQPQNESGSPLEKSKDKVSTVRGCVRPNEAHLSPRPCVSILFPPGTPAAGPHEWQA